MAPSFPAAEGFEHIWHLAEHEGEAWREYVRRGWELETIVAGSWMSGFELAARFAAKYPEYARALVDWLRAQDGRYGYPEDAKPNSEQNLRDDIERIAAGAPPPAQPGRIV
jgi:hypothetical protein